MTITGEAANAGNLAGRTIDDSAKKQLPIPNVPDLNAFNVNSDLHVNQESMETLHKASVETMSIMQKYKAAMREMKVRLEILDQDLNLKKHRNPIHHIESRLKSPASIYEKIGRYGYEPTLEKDYISAPKPNGYRSLHVIVRIPVFFMDKKESIPVEIQLRTLAMDFWASLEHDLKYKAVSEVRGIDASSELKDCSRIIEEVETRMQVLAGALEPEE